MSTTERYVSKSERSEEGISKALKWVKENLSATDYQSIDRQRVADSLSIALSSINRVILALDQQGYLEAKRAGNSGTYRVADVAKLNAVTPEETYAWIRAYNQKCDEKARQKKLAARSGQNSELVALVSVIEQSQTVNSSSDKESAQNQPEEATLFDKDFAESIARKVTPYLGNGLDPTQSTPAVPLSPAHKLLVEAIRLVEAEQNHKSEPEVLPEQLKGLEARLNRLENSTNIILYFFQQASTSLRALPPAQMPVVAEASTAALPDLEPTKREKVRRLVDGYAAAKTVSHQEVWKHLYGNLSSRFGFDAWQHAEGKKDPNYLEIVEKNGQLENLYNIAVELLTLSQR